MCIAYWPLKLLVLWAVLLPLPAPAKADELDLAEAGPVLLVGDSMMRSLERSLTRALERRELVAQASSAIKTGLARLDIYDWPTELAKLAETHGARTVFVMLGVNDNQAMRTGGGIVPHGTETWRTEYGRRVGKTMDALLDHGVQRVVWVGLPVMRESALNADVMEINAIVIRQAAARTRVRFVKTADRFSRDGAFNPYIIQTNGVPLNVRALDGIHLSRPGADYLAGILIEALNGILRASPQPDS